MIRSEGERKWEEEKIDFTKKAAFQAAFFVGYLD